MPTVLLPGVFFVLFVLRFISENFVCFISKYFPITSLHIPEALFIVLTLCSPLHQRAPFWLLLL